MAKECENCAYKSEFKSAECGSCVVSYYDGEQQGLPSNFKPKPMTNADRIRAMSDEELAIFVRAVIMADGCPNGEVDCNECSVMEICNQSGLYEHEKEWLQQPAEGE